MLNLILLLAVGGNGPQFALPWVFWVSFIIWVILGFIWWRPRGGVWGPWYGPTGHAMITWLIFLLGWGLYGLPGIGR